MNEHDFIRDLLWNEHPECCGQPVVGAEYMGQSEELCCGCPEPAMLNDARIVATLRAKFPERSTPAGNDTVAAPSGMSEPAHLLYMASRMEREGHAEAARQYQACAESALRLVGAAGPLGDEEVLAAAPSAPTNTAVAALEEKVRRLREALDSISEITREEYFIRSDSSRVQEIGSYASAALKDTE